MLVPLTNLKLSKCSDDCAYLIHKCSPLGAQKSPTGVGASLIKKVGTLKDTVVYSMNIAKTIKDWGFICD